MPAQTGRGSPGRALEGLVGFINFPQPRVSDHSGAEQVPGSELGLPHGDGGPGIAYMIRPVGGGLEGP